MINDEELIDESLTQTMATIDDRLAMMTIEDQVEYIKYLKGSIEDLESDLENQLKKHWGKR